jgi:hypothetical protein
VPDLGGTGFGALDLDARLPNQVFVEGADDSLFCEFDAVLAPDFWPALCAMARWHGDARVELLVLEPAWGRYPAVSLSVDADVDDYWAGIGYEPNGDIMGSIAISANVIAVTGPSGTWGWWGERDPEVAVSAVSRIRPRELDGVPSSVPSWGLRKPWRPISRDLRWSDGPGRIR